MFGVLALVVALALVAARAVGSQRGCGRVLGDDAAIPV